MNQLRSVIRTTSLIIGVYLVVAIATLEAAPAARKSKELFDLQNTFNSLDMCVNFLQTEFNIDSKILLNSLQLIEDNFDNNDKCDILFRLLHPSFYTDPEVPQRLEILEMLARLGQNMIRDDLENSKRGLGFGLDRAFSGQQAARHLMGLHAATWAGGPGRRRRSDTDDASGKRAMGFGMDRGFSGQQAARYLMGAQAANRYGKRNLPTQTQTQTEHETDE